MEFLSYLITGISLGSIYAIIALGYTMVYGIAKMLNFAHGDVIMVGAYVSFYVTMFAGSNLLGEDPSALTTGAVALVSVLLAMVVCTVLGVVIEGLAYRPLRQAGSLAVLITAIGVSFFLENLFNVLFGGSSRFFSAPDFFNQTRAFGSVIITNVAWIVPLITVLLLLAILWLLYRTRYGMAIRAVAFDVNTVRLMGIDANRIISLVFALGSSLAALGGVFYSISYPTIDPLMGVLIGLKAFAAAVLGGIGSVTGAVLGGFILGFTEVVAVAIFPELGGYKDAFAFLFLILVLLFRPVGIMGDERLERSRF